MVMFYEVGTRLKKLLFAAMLLLAVGWSVPVNAVPNSFEAWLLSSISETPWSIFYSDDGVIIRFYLEHEPWFSGKEEWLKIAGKRLACIGVHPVLRIGPPYKYEIIIFPPPPGGRPAVVENGFIEKNSCSPLDKLPLTKESH